MRNSSSSDSCEKVGKKLSNHDNDEDNDGEDECLRMEEKDGRKIASTRVELEFTKFALKIIYRVLFTIGGNLVFSFDDVQNTYDKHWRS